jgi:hypothetical protein
VARLRVDSFGSGGLDVAGGWGRTRRNLERAVRREDREEVRLQASAVAYLALPFQRSMGHTDTASGYIEDDIFQFNQSFDAIASL